MPYTRITPSRNGREAIQYALGNEENKGHNGNEVRNLAVGTVGMLPEEVMPYADQMQVYWNKASSRNKNQVRRIITSFSKEELDPADPKSAEIALAMLQEHARTYYPGRQVLICIQADGVGGCLHGHEIVNNVSMIDGKGCTDEQTKFHYVAKTIDEVAKKYIDLSMDYKEKFDEATKKAIIPKDRVTQNERRQRDENREAVANGKEAPNYIWKDDLKDRVLQAMEEATSKEDFLKRLTAHGVEGEYRTSKKQGDYIIYELIDTTGFGDGKVLSNLKSKSYKLGSNYGLEALEQQIQKAPKEKLETSPVGFTLNETKTVSSSISSGNIAYAERMKKIQDWAEEKGLDFNTDGVFDYEKYKNIEKAYEEEKTKPQKAQEATQNEKDDKSIVEEEKRDFGANMEVLHHKKQTEENSEEKEPEKTPETPVVGTTNEETQPETISRRQQMIDKLKKDAEQIEKNWQEKNSPGSRNPFDDKF